MQNTSESTPTKKKKSQALPPGEVLGHYRILEKLGQGGFGITYLAEHTQTAQRVVLKENLPQSFAVRDKQTLMVEAADEDNAQDFQWATQRFLDEARLLARLEHPNIVKVTEAFESLGTAYYVMQYVGGTDMGKMAPSPQDISESWLSPILRTLLHALDYLHSQNLLHRDIKPSNILLTDQATPILIDFGSARAMVSERSATMLESPGYSPIEQVQSVGKVGAWTDLYALGAACYRLIIGEKPPRSVDRMGKKDPYVPLASRSKLRGRFSNSFLRSIDKALNVWPEDRWAGATAWLTAIPAEREPLKKAAAVTTPPASSACLPWLIVGVVAVALGSGVWYYHQEMTKLESLNQRLVDELSEASQKQQRATTHCEAAQNSLDEEKNKSLLAQSRLFLKEKELEQVKTQLDDEKQQHENTKKKLEAADKSAMARELLTIRGISASQYTQAMRKACEDGDSPTLLNLIMAGADVNGTDSENNKFKMPHLILAAQKGRTECVSVLLNTPGIDVNKVDVDGWTALYWAAASNHLDCVRLLLDAPGIDVNKADNHGRTALNTAAGYGNPECVKLLLQAQGIDVNRADNDGHTALYWANKNDRTTCARLIREAGGRE